MRIGLPVAGRLALGAGLFLQTTGLVAGSSVSWPQINLTRVLAGVTQPTHITHAGDGSGRLFVVERAGRIRIFKNGLLLTTPFLDITGRVSSAGSEEGLLSVAFPPEYGSKGYFYVYYTNLQGNIVVARYFVSANPDVADPAGEVIVLAVNHPTHANHNGGQLAFGPGDGFLYVGIGDGGGAGDPNNNAQNPGSLLGKLLRIDTETGSPPTYAIPATNPYVGTPGYRGEIWALGLRNPWRFAFDRQARDLYVGDVGQSRLEEVDFQDACSSGGENYGWRILEGSLCYNPSSGCIAPSRYSAPVAEYSHLEGCSVSGGFVYRGIRYYRLHGIYFYGDFCSGRIWGLQYANGTWQTTVLDESGFNISTFGEDQAGNLYLADYSSGEIYLVDFALHCYVLDGFGGLHAGGGAPSMLPSTPYFGYDIAKDLELATAGFYVLDGLGGVHSGGGAPAFAPSTPYFGFDVARDLELATAGFYVLDGWGGLHSGGGAPAFAPSTPYFGFDVARDLELAATGFYVLDGWGGVHSGGGAPVLAPGTPYFGFDVARDLELAATGFYVLDGFGGLHRGAGAPVLAPATPYFGFDVARDLELATTGFYVLDAVGGVHPGGGAPGITPSTPYFGFDIAKDLEIR